MAQFFINFEDYDDGDPAVNHPSEFSVPWGYANHSVSVESSGLPDDRTFSKTLRIQGTSTGNFALALPGIGSIGPDSEILVRMLYAHGGPNNGVGRALLMIGGSSGNAQGYGSNPQLFAGAVQLVKWVDNTQSQLDSDSTTISNDDWFGQRLRYDSGAADELKLKWWIGDVGDEPSPWNLEASDTDHSSGLAGIGHFRDAGTLWVDWIGVGTDGDSAPSEAVTPEELTVFAETNDGELLSNAVNDYPAARAGTGTITPGTAGATSRIGQSDVGIQVNVYETFESYDVSSLSTDAETAALHVWLTTDSSDVDFTIEARAYDWGDTLTEGDWVPGADLSSLPLLASLSTSGISTGAYEELTSETALVTAINAARAGDGILRVVFASSRTTSGDAPTATELIVISTADETADPTQRPKLVITVLDTTPVSSTREALWALRGIIADSRAVLWDVRGVTSGPQEIAWGVRGSASAVRQLAYSMTSHISSNRLAEWNLAALAASSREAAWDVRGVLGDTKVLSWQLNQAIQAERLAAWDVRAVLSLDREASWGLRGSALSSRAALHAVRALAYSERLAVWNVASIAAIVARHDLIWSVRRSIGDSRPLLWGVRDLAASAHDLSWAERSLLTPERDLRWDVRANIGSQNTLTWIVRASAPFERLIVWTVEREFLGQHSVIVVTGRRSNIDAISGRRSNVIVVAGRRGNIINVEGTE